MADNTGSLIHFLEEKSNFYSPHFTYFLFLHIIKKTYFNLCLSELTHLLSWAAAFPERPGNSYPAEISSDVPWTSEKKLLLAWQTQ